VARRRLARSAAPTGPPVGASDRVAAAFTRHVAAGDVATGDTARAPADDLAARHALAKHLAPRTDLDPTPIRRAALVLAPRAAQAAARIDVVTVDHARVAARGRAVIHVVAAKGAAAVLTHPAAALHVVAVLIAVSPVAAEIALLAVPTFTELPFLAPVALTPENGEHEEQGGQDTASEFTEHGQRIRSSARRAPRRSALGERGGVVKKRGDRGQAWRDCCWPPIGEAGHDPLLRT